MSHSSFDIGSSVGTIEVLDARLNDETSSQFRDREDGLVVEYDVTKYGPLPLSGNACKAQCGHRQAR